MIEKLLQELTNQIKRLNDNLEKGAAHAPAFAETKEAQKETPKEEAPASVTREEIQSYCVERVREQPGFKAEAKKVLESFGARTVTKLQDKDLEAAFKALKEVKL